MAILMMKDKPVYDIAKNTVLDEMLCPFVDRKNTKRAYALWRKHRFYLKTNRTAERVIAQAGGEHTKEAKRRLSLSDCYWVQYPYDKDVKFIDITPYKNPFSLIQVHRGGVASSAVPELVLGGSQPKQWGLGQDGVTYMSKAEQGLQIHGEMLAVKLAHASGLKSMNTFVRTEKGKLYAKNYPLSFNYHSMGIINLVNMTSLNRSLIQFDQLGIAPNGYDPTSVAEAYRTAGVQADVTKIALTQVMFDAVVGNMDRKSNNSNWGIFLDNTTGVRTPSWLYDFNWANITTATPQMIEEVAMHIKNAGLADTAKVLLVPIINACEDLSLTLWKQNAEALLGYIFL